MSPLRPPKVSPAAVSRFAAPAIVLLLALHWFMATTAARDKSVGFDEIIHVTGGYSYWTLNDYRIQPDNGVFPQRLGALPLLGSGLTFPDLEQPAWREAGLWEIGHQFFFDSGNDAREMLRRSRSVTAIIGVGLALLIYFWSRRLFGSAGGFLSLSLAVFCPAFLAQGALVTSDLELALTLAGSVWSFWELLHHLRWRSFALAAGFIGLLFVSKMSAFLFVPMAVLMILIRLLRRQSWKISFGRRSWSLSGVRVLPTALATGLLLAFSTTLIIWSFYGLRYEAFGGSGGGAFFQPWSEVLPTTSPAREAVTFVREHRLLPEAFIYGACYVGKNTRTRPAFLNGHYSLTGWPWFFPYSFLIKTPLPLFALLLLALPGAFRKRGTRGQTGDGAGGDRSGGEAGPMLYRLSPLLVLLFVYGAALVASSYNIGTRHLSAIYPALYVLGGGAATWFNRRTPVAGAAVGLALAAFAICSLSIRPHYLAYFNSLVGGPRNGYRHLVDSAIDWGQDLPGLERWLERRGSRGRPGENVASISTSDATGHPRPVYLSYFGMGRPDATGVDMRRLPGFLDFNPPEVVTKLEGGTYCISVTMLQSLYTSHWGPWGDAYEIEYQEACRQVNRFLHPEANQDHLLEHHGPGYWQDVLARHDSLRFARLCAYLRTRQPDDRIGYSILVYDLSDEDVEMAVNGVFTER